MTERGPFCGPLCRAVPIAAVLLLARPGTGMTEPSSNPGPVPKVLGEKAQKPPVVGDDAATSAGQGETIEILDAAPAGAQAELAREVLERDEHDDLHKVLAAIAGVYVRDEDGYGLRPNIGMRGVAADRSAKITLLEDGVLSGPAPYTAPAAYYVPLVTRMSRIVVTKGPAAVLYGPATVGGAVNMISEPMPGQRSAYVDLAGGSDLYGKLHVRAAERRQRWGVMAEYVKLRSDGFKDLDGGGDTGFSKDDIQFTGLITSEPSAAIYHQLELRAGYGGEVSNETYLGLSTADFTQAPQRRYVASQLDRMSWDQWRLRAAYRLESGSHTRFNLTAYHHRFDRVWGKIDAFIGERDLFALLARPNVAANAVYFAVLTGAADSQIPEEQLVFGTNDRQFTSQGVQSQLSAERTTAAFVHHLDIGARLHFDEADRVRHEDGYDMQSGRLMRSARARETVLDSHAQTLALAAYANDRVRYGRLEANLGVRIEWLRYRYRDQISGDQQRGDYAVLIPGGGVQVEVSPELAVLAGVHRGFVPVAPSAAAEVEPESSVNYEAGARWRSSKLAADAVAFVSDYKNLKGSCTLSAGCTETMDGREFNGGRVLVWGLELQAGSEVAVPNTSLAVPVSGAYTLSQSEFRSSFASEFVGWGEIESGDELPYLPMHQLSLTAGVRQRGLDDRGWQLSTTANLRSASRDVAGQGTPAEEEKIAALLTFDASAHWRMRSWAELYLTCSNLLDEQVVVSRRPYGARPNPPRMLSVGYKARF